MRIRKVDVMLLLVSLIVIFVRYQYTKLDLTDGQRVRLTGKVTSEPIRYERAQAVTLHGKKMYLDLFPEISYGDEIVVEGVVDGDAISTPKLIEITQSTSFLYKLRNRIVGFYRHWLPQPHSSLVAGVVLGSKSGLPGEFWEILKTTGTAHVVVASGMNVSLVAGFLMIFLLEFLPRKRAVVLALVGIWTYAILSGFDAPIVRSAIMGSIAFSAQALGRLTSAFRGLVISALVMLIIKPVWVTDLGFILSFVATLSILVFDSKVKRYLGKVPSLIRDDLSTTLSAQIGVAPILFVVFGQFNLMSPIINAVILWTIPPITIIGMVAAVFSLIWESAARLVLYLAYPLTSWFVWVVEVFS